MPTRSFTYEHSPSVETRARKCGSYEVTLYTSEQVSPALLLPMQAQNV